MTKFNETWDWDSFFVCIGVIACIGVLAFLSLAGCNAVQTSNRHKNDNITKAKIACTQAHGDWINGRCLFLGSVVT